MLTLQDRLLLAELRYDPDRIKQRLPMHLQRDFNAPLGPIEEVEYAVTGLEHSQLSTPTASASTRSILTVLTATQERIYDPDEQRKAWLRRRRQIIDNPLDDDAEYDDEPLPIKYSILAMGIVNDHRNHWYESYQRIKSDKPFDLKRTTYEDTDGDVHDTIALIGAHDTTLELYGRKIRGVECCGEVYTPSPHPVRIYSLPEKEEFDSNIFWRELAKQSGTMMVDTHGRGGGNEILFECVQGSLMTRSFCEGDYPTTIQSREHFDVLVEHFRKEQVFCEASRRTSRIETLIPHYQGSRFLPILNLLAQNVEIEK